MKQQNFLYKFWSGAVVVLVVFAGCPVHAQETAEPPNVLPGVIITELQTGLGAGQTDKEYVELYNATEEPQDLDGWQLWYMPESRTAPEAYRVVLLDGVIQPHTHIVLSSEGYTPNQVVPAQAFEKMLSAEGGNIALLAPTGGVCQMAVQDAFAWGAGLLGAGDPAASLPKTKDKAFARLVTDGTYRNTRNNSADFVSDTFSGSTSTVAYLGTPGASNAQTAVSMPELPVMPGVSFMQPIVGPNCEPPEELPASQPPQTTSPTTDPPATVAPTIQDDATSSKVPVFPERSKGLASPHITELLPNPASPQTDAADEFIELYNSNDKAFELTGFKLVSGKRSYVFPAGTLVEPKSFTAYYSADTKLALSNSGGQVQLLDPFGNAIAQSGAYGAAKDGQSWALANGKWQWTASPTPNAANVIQVPVAAGKKKTASKTGSSAAAVKGASTTSGNQLQPATQQLASTAPSPPIHPGVLALVGVFALLYGIYEYRGDLANKLYQLRAYRAARRSLRQKPEGRGSD